MLNSNGALTCFNRALNRNDVHSNTRTLLRNQLGDILKVVDTSCLNKEAISDVLRVGALHHGKLAEPGTNREEHMLACSVFSQLYLSCPLQTGSE